MTRPIVSEIVAALASVERDDFLDGLGPAHAVVTELIPRPAESPLVEIHAAA